MSVRTHFQAVTAAAIGSLLFAAACSESPVRTGPSPIPAGGKTNIAGDRIPQGNEFELCKDFAATPPAGTTVTFVVRVDQDNTGTFGAPFNVTLNPGACQIIWNDVGIGRDIVEVTEQVPTGFQTPTWQKIVLEGGGAITSTSGTGATESGPVAHDDVGTTLIFRNTATPSDGGEGCTPGFWKTHTDAWQGFTTGQSFDAVFGLGSPGLFNPDKTLLQALNLGGGGFNKLARSAVAALLNAAHSGVDYGMTTSQIITAVQNAFTSGNPEPLATTLDNLNNEGCSIDD
jgi:hypothetical protein